MALPDPESGRPERASANGLLTRPVGTGRRREIPATPSETFAWSARRAGTPEMGETRVIVLITQLTNGRARCVPDRPVNAGNSRSLMDSPTPWLACGQAR